MKILTILARILDTVVSLGLLIVGMYLFFWQHLWITGAVVIAVHSFYQLSTIYCLKKLE